VYSLLLLCVVVAACARTAPPPPPPLTPITSGTLTVGGLSAPVRVVRDRWGIPHIYAESANDLFLAQGFVQAEDRLFQMDLWRRASLGRLAEVLGPNFVERDGMTRRMQFAGDMDAEWAGYGPGMRSIAAAFTRGINAWVALAHDRPPEEFVLAGWTPGFWSETDILNRTDAFLASGDALDEIRRAGISDVVADAVRQVGPPPFFAGSTQTPAAFTVSGGRAQIAARDGALTMSEAPRTLDVPARRYVVHLHAPGWNVVGLSAPWLPGVVAGHNEQMAWAGVSIDADTQDVLVEPATSGDLTTTTDMLRVKGRPRPEPFRRQQTASGVVLATDNEHHAVYTLRWSGLQPGTAAELAAIAVDRASTIDEMRAALSLWKLPARRFVFLSKSGPIGFQDAALLPRRSHGDWIGWLTPDDLKHGTSGAIDAEGPPAPAAAPDDRAVFAHTLGVTAAARARFNIGPVIRGTGSPTRAVFDVRDWDRSSVLVAPGESANAASAHYADLASAWSKGSMVPLLFTDAAVASNAAETLTLVPR